MIRPAKANEILKLLEITKSCAKHMISNGIYQWNEHYPTHGAFQEDLSRDELYVLVQEEKIIGCITLSTVMDDEYLPIDWLTANKNNLYIHRLAVHPDYQKKGHAQRLMNFAEETAKTEGFKSLRLDTFSQNKRNQKFYEQRGYQRLGDIYFPKQSIHPFHCYELVLQ